MKNTIVDDTWGNFPRGELSTEEKFFLSFSIFGFRLSVAIRMRVIFVIIATIIFRKSVYHVFFFQEGSSCTIRPSTGFVGLLLFFVKILANKEIWPGIYAPDKLQDGVPNSTQANIRQHAWC